MNYLENLQQQLQPYRQQLLAHPMYPQLKTKQHLQTFTQHHVWAVWDFMSLLKSLQRHLTCVQAPWVPVGSANTRFLINEIVVGEESDVDEAGNRISHFELYLQAMKALGASTAAIEQFIALLQKGTPIQPALAQVSLPGNTRAFVNYTFAVIEQPVHVQAAVFTFGREDLIPDMFTQLLQQLSAENPAELGILKYYIERHIEVDGGHHSQLALQMVEEFCGNDAEKWQQATEASIKALEIRYQLWSGILLA
jgi:hypothetical protein